VARIADVHWRCEMSGREEIHDDESRHCGCNWVYGLNATKELGGCLNVAVVRLDSPSPRRSITPKRYGEHVRLTNRMREDSTRTIPDYS
jgi:hypothetical protein